MHRFCWFAIIASTLTAAACGSSGGGGTTDKLQSDCVRESLGESSTPRTKADGSSCSNFGYADCPGERASECVHYCAFDICQAAECTSDADCAQYGGTCEHYVVSGATQEDYGQWCRPGEIMTGGGGGGICDGCGGVFCSGNCIGCPGC